MNNHNHQESGMKRKSRNQEDYDFDNVKVLPSRDPSPQQRNNNDFLALSIGPPTHVIPLHSSPNQHPPLQLRSRAAAGADAGAGAGAGASPNHQFIQKPQQQPLLPPPTMSSLPLRFANVAPANAASLNATPANAAVHLGEQPAEQHGVRPRARKKPSRRLEKGESEPIVPPYPWATDRRARVHSVKYLLDKGITTITGKVHCKKCQKNYEIEYDLAEKFREVVTYARMNKPTMHDRAPIKWLYPRLPCCKFCGQQNSVKPVLSERKQNINWLFLLLGQMLGCCTLEQLKYFCKHTKNHRTGAKDRVLYSTYFELCDQLEAEGPL